MPVGLPSDLDFQMKKTLPRGVRAFRQNISPIGGLGPGGETQNLKFDVPTSRYGQYLDTSACYLQFRVQAGPTGAITLDGSAYSFLQRFTVLSGGTIVEDVNCINTLAQLFLDSQLGPTVRQTTGNIMMGCGADDVANAANIVRTGVVIPAGGSMVFCLPLISGFFGNLSKYLPVGAIQNDLRIEIMLENQNNAVVNTTINPTGWSITSAELVLNFVELEADVQKMVDASTGGTYMISSETWRWFSNTVAGNTSSDSVLIPARYSSVKGLIGSFRPSAYQNNFLRPAQTHRVNPFNGPNASIQFQIGSQLYPNAPIRSAPELFAETQKYFHALGNTDMRGCIGNFNWLINADPTALVVGANSAAIFANFQNSGSGLWAINLDSVQNRSDVLNSGLSTLNLNVMANFQYANQYGSQLRLDSWSHIDMVLVIENGILSVRV